MKPYPIKLEAVKVATETGVCVGMAKTKQGETYIMDGRSPESPGMCSNAFCALANQAYAMRVTDQLQGEADGCVDRVCPHGVVTFRLSRSETGKTKAYNTK